ncbi:MAG: steroid delta-isomerase [Deltaproteobacteria bacterium]|nr:steroid delta-isomerase [Deltaproteobacteria bacterium]
MSSYLERHGRNDLEAVVALFEEEATVEDPVGSPIHHGIDAIRDFYGAIHASLGPMRIERVGPARVGGEEIAFHIRAGLEKPGSPPAMDVIYVIEVGASGRIAGLRAWF